MMETLLTIVVYVVAIAISTAVFGASLFLVEDINESSFRTDGQAVTWGKCAGLMLVTTVLGRLTGGFWLLPLGPLLALIAFLVGVMALYQMLFSKALLLLIINGFFSLGVAWLIDQVLASWAPSG